MRKSLGVAGAWLVLTMVLPHGQATAHAQQTARCPSCASAAALISRFQLTESQTPVRDRANWSAPRKIVTIGGEEWAAELRRVAPGAEIIGIAEMNPQAIIPALADADVYIGICVPEIVQAGPSLRWIHLATAGADACVDVPPIADGRILLTNGQGVFAPQIADHAMGLLLTLTRQLKVYHIEQGRGAWSHAPANPEIMLTRPFLELEGKRMLVLGLGGIGTEIARRGDAFGMPVRATRNSSREGPDFVEYVGLSDETFELAAWADVVVNALPLTSATRGLLDVRFFEAMKPGSILINVGRGETVITNDLVEALRAGRIAGAGLDVTDPEPIPSGHPLWNMPNVVITPHIAGLSDVLLDRLLVLASENLRRYVAGERILSVVNPRRGY